MQRALRQRLILPNYYRMKKALTFLFAVLSFSLVLAQTAPKFSYQAVIRNGLNELVTDDTVVVRLRLYNHGLTSAAIYSERHSVVSNANGLISLMIGEGTEVTGNLSQVAWDDALVGTEITLRGDYSASDIKPVTAVPFAYYADRISLQALEEHLGSTNLVSTDALRDTLSLYVTLPSLSDTLLNYVTFSGLTDMLDSYVPTSGLSDYVSGALSDSLVNYVPRYEWETAIQRLWDEINAVTTIVDNITVTNYQTTSNQFILGHSPLSNRKVLMFINGVLISQSSYNVAGNQVMYFPANNGNKSLEEGDRVQIYYYYK